MMVYEYLPHIIESEELHWFAQCFVESRRCSITVYGGWVDGVRLVVEYHYNQWEEDYSVFETVTPVWMHRYLQGDENPQVGGILL